MALELVYTSAQRGLRPGSSGFCTVAMTRGMPPALVPRLESLGGYRPGSDGAGPRTRSFWRIEAGGSEVLVLAVVGPAPPDHTHRTNKIASYLVLGPREQVPAGPAWLLAQPGLFRESWAGPPALLDQPIRLPDSGPVGPRPCLAWGRASGDSGWAGVVASHLLRDPSKPVHVIWSQGHDPLELIQDVLCLMPSWAKWRTTFATHFLQPVAGAPCSLRMCPAGAAAALAARESKGVVFDLSRMQGVPPDGRFVRMARSGIDEQATQSRGSGGRAPVPEVDGPDIELEPLADDQGALRPRLPSRSQSRSEVLPLSGRRNLSDASRPAKAGLLAVAAAGLTVIVGAVLYALSASHGPKGRAAGGVNEGGKLDVAAAPQPAEAAVTTPPDSPRPVLPDGGTPDIPDETPLLTRGRTPPTQDVGPAAGVSATDSVPAAAPPPSEATESSPSAPGPELPAEVTPVVADAGEPAAITLPPLPSGLVGPRWRMERDPSGPADESVVRWTRSFPSSMPSVASATFVVSDHLRRLGLQSADGGARLLLEGSAFEATMSIADAGRTLLLDVRIPDAPPPEAALACLPCRVDPTRQPWESVVAIVVAEVRDAFGAVMGTVQCAPIGTPGRLDAAAGTPTKIADVPCVPLLAQVFADPGAPDQRRVLDQAFIAPGGACELSATALVRISVDRAEAAGFVVATAEALDEAQAGRRIAALKAEVNHIDGLVKELRSLRDRGLSPPLSDADAALMDAAWEQLSESERREVSPSSPDALPGSEQGRARVIAALFTRLTETRRSLVEDIKELKPKDGALPRMSLRIATLDGAVLDDQPIRWSSSSRAPR
jgi:hypothetical protein